MSGFYATDEFGCDPFAAPTVPAVPPSTPVTNPFLQQGQATAATATAIAPTPTPSPLSTSAAASASAAAVMAAKAAAALPTPTSAPTPVGNPFEETDVFAQAPAVIPSPAKPATMAPAAPALVVSPMVAPSPVDAFFGPAVAPTTPVLAPPTLAASGSGSFHSPAPAPVVPVPVAAMAALSLAPPVVVSPAKKPAAPAVDTSDFDPYSPAKRASMSMSMSASASASASASISASASASAASPVVATSPSKAVTTPAPAPVKEAEEEEEEEEDWGIEWNKPEQQSIAAPEAKAPAVGSPSKQQQTAAQAATGATTTTATATAVPEGVCLARVTTRSIFVREWKPAFWVIINQRLWIYRSKADYKPTDYIHDPFSERIKKCIHLRDNLRVTEMKSKMYPGESKTLYTFSIEDMDEDGGKSLTAKFAAYNYDQLKKLRDEVEERVWAARHVRK